MIGEPSGQSRIGPNAVTRMFEALRSSTDDVVLRRVAERAGLGAYVAERPEAMVEEREVEALHRAVWAECGATVAVAIADDAGRRTGDYLLANRIPRPAQSVLRVLPPAASSACLLAAIGRHAWTFAGSGAFVVQRRAPARLAIEGGPIMRLGDAAPSLVAYYAGTFARLYQVLVSPRSEADGRLMERGGRRGCTIAIDWRRS
ncbi:MAG: bacteriochlorophyll 4-vinyl reductase [Pseudomonadota bacterium]